MKPRRTWPQRLLIAFNVCFVIGLLGTATGLGYVYSKYSRLPRVELGAVLSDTSAAGEAENYLIVGVDSAEGLDPDNPVRAERERTVGGLRSDTVMILRVDPNAERAALLSLPRDLWVPIAGTRGNQRINVAIEEGGPETLIETVQDYLSIPINHYVQIDFAGFQDLVSSVGGVPVYFPYPARDRQSGLSVTEAGCVELDGAQALAYARSRAYQYFERGRWRTDPTGDLGRISRQQDFIRRALKRAVAKGVRNPVTLNRLIDVGLGSVTVDDQLKASDIFELGNRFRTFNPDTLEMFALPVEDDTVGGAAVLRLQDKKAQPVLALFRGIEPGGVEAGVEPTSVRVKVLNGSGVAGQASTVSHDLGRVGFGVAGTGDAESFDFTRTVVRYAPGDEEAADVVLRWLEAGAELEEVESLVGADVVVVSGSDYDGVRTEALPSTSTSTTSGSSPTSTSTARPTSSTTSTTIIGEVPEAPSNEVSC